MQYDDVLRGMTPEIYQRMLSAVETGRWPDGQKLTDAQKENAMQLVMLYQAKRLNQSDHFSVNSLGELVMKSKRDLREDLRAKAQLREGNDIARFKIDDPNNDNLEH
ncbi:YeaC family protein [Aliidiomarina quisquiliarum]|uniref:YeaC family protein n=1 Tax=Aliidiomarina quisquiliarum TaxID=2938947 RepID=UPI00208DE160|nr:DUF1315 family protein [Aliidiomarina quisquiliarum]MCO4320758.1 DUF1315 family protein [Aliidiomarina quisquiliarum]